MMLSRRDRKAHRLSPIWETRIEGASLGFTLLELLIALAIMVIAVVGIVRGVSNGLVVVQSLTRRAEAINLARAKMEELLASIDEQPNEQEGDFGDAFPQFKWRAQISDSPVDGLRIVTVTVIWFEGANERTVSLGTAIGEEALTSLPPAESESASESSGAVREESSGASLERRSQ